MPHFCVVVPLIAVARFSPGFRIRLSEQWFMHGSITLTDLKQVGFTDKIDSYLKIDRDAAEAEIGGGRTGATTTVATTEG